MYRFVKDVRGSVRAVVHVDIGETPATRHHPLEGDPNVSAETWTHNLDDQLEQLTYSGGGTYYQATYDDNGNIKTRTADGQATTLSHDGLGQLRSVVFDGAPSSTTVSYTYDSDGRRVGRLVGGTLQRQWVYGSALGPIAELDGAGNVTSRFIYATHSHAPDLMLRAGEVYRLVKDVRGSVRAVVHVDTGAVVQRTTPGAASSRPARSARASSPSRSAADCSTRTPVCCASASATTTR